MTQQEKLRHHLERCFSLPSAVDQLTEAEKIHDSLITRAKELDKNKKLQKEIEAPPFKYLNSKMPKDTLGRILWLEEEIYSLWLTAQLNPRGNEQLGQRFENKRKFKHQVNLIKTMKQENHEIQLKLVE